MKNKCTPGARPGGGIYRQVLDDQANGVTRAPYEDALWLTPVEWYQACLSSLRFRAELDPAGELIFCGLVGNV